MPTVLRKDGFRFYFYSNENDEPAHVHVEKGEGDGKIWLLPKIDVAYMYNFSNAEMKQIAVIVFENYEQFKRQWNEYFD
ncbi:MAG: DUF4160 domain-containing protein [Bacteroidota bacterium]